MEMTLKHECKIRCSVHIMYDCNVVYHQKHFTGSRTSFVRSIITKSSALRKINWCSRTHLRAILPYINCMAMHL